MNLEETIKRCQLGETLAFRELFSHMEQKAFGTAYLISGNRGLAEDIVQETYMRCMEQIKTLKNPEAFYVWFYRMIVRIGWRMIKKHTRLIPDENLPQVISPDNTEEQVQAALMNKTLYKAIEDLSGNLKTVVVLFYFNGMSVDEIARVTGSFKATVKTRLYYARNALHKKLKVDMFPCEEVLVGKSRLKKAEG